MKKGTRKKGFSLLELIVVMVIMAILAAVLIPLIGDAIETAYQATDNANARTIYMAAAMWFSDHNLANSNLTVADLEIYLGFAAFPTAESAKFAGNFSVSVTISGYITVATSKPATFDPQTGKLTT